MPLAFSKSSPKPASGSDSDSFQITASVLNLGACASLDATFESRIYVAYSCLDLLNVNLADFQSQAFYLLTFLVPEPRRGAQAWNPGSMGRTSKVVVFLPF